MSLFHKEFDEVPIEIFRALQKAWEADKSLVHGVGLILSYDLSTKRYRRGLLLAARKGGRMTPREIAVTTGKTVYVDTGGFAYFTGRHSEKESRLLEKAKITDEDWDNVYYPDGTSEWERMRDRPVSKEVVDFLFKEDKLVEA